MIKLPLCRVVLVRESPAKYVAVKANSAMKAYKALRPLFKGLDREHFVVCCLDSGLKIIAVNVVSVGSLNLAIVHPREVFKAAILANACSVILAHNHPSGDPTPSREDITLSQRLREAGEILGIKVLDSLVIGESSFRNVPAAMGIR